MSSFLFVYSLYCPLVAETVLSSSGDAKNPWRLNRTFQEQETFCQKTIPFARDCYPKLSERQEAVARVGFSTPEALFL